MKYRSIACPQPTPGVSFIGTEDLVVPDQSMSLEEILHRFTRGEPVPVGKEANWDEEAENSDVDLEKLKHMDLVDREEYVRSLEEVKRKHAVQEKRKQAMAKAAQEKAAKEAEEKRIRIAARKLAKGEK